MAGTYRFKTGFYSLRAMLAEIQKAIDRTLIGLTNTYSFLYDTLILSGTVEDSMKLVRKCLKKLHENSLRINLPKCYFLPLEN